MLFHAFTWPIDIRQNATSGISLKNPNDATTPPSSLVIFVSINNFQTREIPIGEEFGPVRTAIYVDRI
jgi:hypothetical protein